MRVLRPLALLLVMMSAPVGSVSWAKGGDSALPEIQETGITSFDSVFQKVDAIIATLDRAEGRLNAARD
jgi:hypothetical protein